MVAMLAMAVASAVDDDGDSGGVDGCGWDGWGANC